MAGNEDFFEYTNNLNLRLILSGANLDIEDLNYNPKKIDGWPQIIETGGNDDLKYLKFSNGMYIMYGRGTDDQLNCNKQVVSAGAMYKSENSTVVFPITTKTRDVILLDGGCNHERSTTGYGHRETEAYVYDEKATELVYYYSTPQDEGPYSPKNVWAKEFNLLIIGTY